MEIQKIFSDESGIEKLYSVSLNEEEFKLFSEFQKEFGNRENKLLKKAWERREALKQGFQKYTSDITRKTIPTVSTQEAIGKFRALNGTRTMKHVGSGKGPIGSVSTSQDYLHHEPGLHKKFRGIGKARLREVGKETINDLKAGFNPERLPGHKDYLQFR